MRVLVTGGCGFVGSNLVDKLVDQGHKVVVLDDLSSGKKEYCNPSAEYCFEDFKVFLRSAPKLDIDVIFHLAAQARIQPSFGGPLHTIENNAYGTAIICEMARRNNCKVVYAGSSTFYGGPHLNPYAFAKWQGEQTCKMYASVYGTKIAITRFFNVYGPRNPHIGAFTPIIAKFEQQLKAGEPLTVVGSGEQRRDFTHVEDICEGLIAISAGEWLGEEFDLGTGTNYSINEIVEMFGTQKRHLPSRPGEAMKTLATVSKTTELTGWLPKNKLADYIEGIKNEIK